ncbi:MAG: magnesium/cobalt transporter CorA [Elusimicrobia bacterium]|nr:magnesium/cobalt transporter CorA [Elusimicrobiota bacterium]
MNKSLTKLLSSVKLKNTGQPPGTLTAQEKTSGTAPPKITVIDYSENSLQENTIDDIASFSQYKNTDTKSWINISSLGDIETIKELGEVFSIHPLVLEDILDTDGRPKIEDLDDMVFTRIKMVYFKNKSNEIITEQVSMILGKGFLLTFQEYEEDVFEQIRNRIRNARGKIRKMDCSYLFYSIIDAIVDNYFHLPAVLGENLEGVEEKILKDPEPEDISLIHKIKSDLILIRRAIWPLREIINSVLRGEYDLIDDNIQIYLRDLYDHIIQVVDWLETFRDIVGSLIDTYMTSVSNKMNEVMKVLTIIATIFIPLTFVAGIYGMNFENMPELGWKSAYFIILGVMFLIAAGMVAYFKKKNWL